MASHASSRIAQPSSAGHGRSSGSNDQRKKYTDWANNRLRRAGLTDWLITDLQKDVPDGVHLPRVIKSIMLEDVPNLVQTPTSDADKRHNIDACIKLLQSRGVNSSGFTSKDIADGSMRSILMMFFSLSQYRPKGDSDSSGPPSRICRPTSPSLKYTHGITPINHNASSSASHSSSNSPLTHSYPPNASNTNSSVSSLPKLAPNRASSSTPTPPVVSPSSKASTPIPISPSAATTTSSTADTAPTTNSSSSAEPPSSTVLQPPTGGSTSLRHRPSMGRRFGGSSIPTGMDPLGGQPRRVPYRPVVLASEKDKDSSSTDDEEEKPHKDSATLPAGMKLSSSPIPSDNDSSKTDIEAVRKASQPVFSSSIPNSDGINKLKPPTRSHSVSAPRNSGLVKPSSRLQKLGETKSVESGLIADKQQENGVAQPVRNKSDPAGSNSTSDTGASDEEKKQTHPQRKSGLVKGSGLRMPQGTPSPLLKAASSGNGADTEDKTQSKLPQAPGSKLTKPSSSDQSSPSDNNESSAMPKPGFIKTKLAPPSGSKLAFFQKQPGKPSSSPIPSPSSSNAPPLVSPPTEPENQTIPPSPHSSKTSLLSSTESLENAKSPTIPPPKGFETAAPTATKSNIPPPLEIPGSTPPSGDMLGSTSSMSSTNSQAESTNAEILTPSPSSNRKYGRRTSPEGMSVDETASPRECKDTHLSSESLGEDDVATAKEAFATAREALRERNQMSQLMAGAEREGTTQQQQVTKPKDSTSSPLQSPSKGYVKRARSLSPKSSRRIRPMPPPAGVPDSAVNATSKINDDQKEKAKFPRSALRGAKHLRGNLHVTISPHSSTESFSSSNASLSKSAVTSPQTTVVIRNEEGVIEGERRISQTERPKSMEALESHSFSQQAFPGDLNSGLVRHGSTRSERLDYSEVADFLKAGRLQELAQARRGNEKSDSTPELLETFENQLSSLRKDLENKDRMLVMYENSMADLSSTLHSLKRSLEEKDAAIKHLTEERHRWQHETAYDARSYAPSRLLPSDAGGLSDGALSDTPMEPEGKETKKKSKKWKKFSLRRSKKDADVNSNLDTMSIASSVAPAGGSKSLKRNNSRRPPDLMSISEYGTGDHRPARLDIMDNKSMMFDATSESGFLTPSGFIEEEPLCIYEEEGPGMSVQVELVPSSTAADTDVIILGTLKLSPETSWVSTDAKIATIFKYHITTIDPSGHLGLTDDSILQYWFTDTCRMSGNALLPLVTPYQAASSDPRVRIIMKGAAQGSCDSLSYKALTSSSMLESYIAMLQETQWLVVMGTKGTCKTTMGTQLVNHLELLVSEGDPVEGGIISFNLAAAGTGLDSTLKYLKEQLPKKIESMPYPPVVFLDGVYDCNVLEQIFSVAETFETRPYIISTLNSGGGTRGSALHQLMFHHNIRVITCSPHSEPVAGILSRSLRKKVYKLKGDPTVEVDSMVDKILTWLPQLLDYLNFFITKFHSNNVALGPRVFMNCPLETLSSDIEVWFINLWNHFIIPYLMGTIMAGIETYSADPRLDWIDVREWVMETYPWQLQPVHSMHKLRTLNPDDVGWSHAVRPAQNRFMYMRDDDTQSVLGRIS